MSVDNYYKVGGSLEYQHPTYVVRQADSDLYEGLKNGDFCYVLNSRQMGKSSLRVQMMKKLKEQGIKCASIDMTRIGSHVSPQEWYGGVVSELLRGFSLSRKVDFSTWWRQRELLPPLQRLSEFIEDVLLAEFSQNIVIFIDELDSVIKIKFKDDFFAFIRACYNQRVDNSEYKRLTFCLLGVATPSDLIADKNLSTPFNIGRAIELTGFQLHEATPLAQGLAEKSLHPQAVLSEVLAWTGGQPFLTQKLCKLLLTSCESIPKGREAAWVENLVRSQIIENWETQDEPEHLRTIRDRLLWSQRQGQLLELYRQILLTGEIKANDKPEQIELRLSGLVVKQGDKLRVCNRIYASIFNLSWVENALAKAGLLPKIVETPAPFKVEIQALEKAAFDALRQFESEQIEALLLAMQAGQALKGLVSDGVLVQDYPTISPLLALQTILDHICERNHFKSHDNMVYDVCFSPDGQLLATTTDDGTVQLWNLFGQQLAEWKGHQGKVYEGCFSPDGQCLATAGRDGTAKLWNLAGQQLNQFYGHRWVLSVSFSPDGQHLATAGADGTARLWDLSGQQIAQFDGHHLGVWSVSFNADGELIATAGVDGTARLWNLSGQQIAQCNGHQSEVWGVSFSPGGQRMATAGADGTARLWNLSGQQIAQFDGHQNWVRSAIFSPDGLRLATAGYDGTARLWNLSGQGVGQQLVQLNGHVGAVLGISFSPDGQHLVSTGGDGTVRLWDLSEKQLVQWNGFKVIWRMGGGLDELLYRGCDWLKDYLVTHPEALEKLEVCKNRAGSIGRNIAEAVNIEAVIANSPFSAPVVPNRLSCEREIDYTRLRDLLASELTFNTTAPVGHLPGGLLDWLWLSFSRGKGRACWDIISFIASRFSEPALTPTTIQPTAFGANFYESGEGFLGVILIHDKSVRIYQGDITKLATDVIVSSTSTDLEMSSGVSKRIRDIGGDEIYREAKSLTPLFLGDVAVTTAGKLQAKKIFHGVVIDWRNLLLPSEYVIRQVVHSCIESANKYGFQSIAFPLLGTGAGGFPVKLAWETILKQIIKNLSDKEQNLTEVIIVLYRIAGIAEELNVRSFLERIERFGWSSLL